MNKEKIKKYWKYTISQNAKKMKEFFDDNAIINWHNTNEHFTVDEYIKVNCEYPNIWYGNVERIEEFGELITTVTRVYNNEVSFHCVSFIKIKNDKIISIDEYWGDDVEVPKWRVKMNVGKKISDLSIVK
ncbi:MAG: hypothetical protein CSB15_01070 [Clostridiales bacterium]|nr:MAG: hypothetical protein CSB15_01070 [Clostridiales bacterium]